MNNIGAVTQALMAKVATAGLAQQERCACGAVSMYGWSVTPVGDGKLVGQFTPPTIESEGVRHTWGKCERREWAVVAERGE